MNKKKYQKEERRHKKKIDKENLHHEKMHDTELKEFIKDTKRKTIKKIKRLDKER